jgi:Ala-tRNA(Pro) deacylase
MEKKDMEEKNMEERDRVLNKLDELGVAYEVERHPAVFTIGEMEASGICGRGEVAKNLFLRDAGGKRHFLVMLQKDKTADLQALRVQLGCSRLSFASAERLDRLLKLTKGSVSPLGILNDAERAVEVAVDRDLTEKTRLGVHPNDNTATVWLAFADLKKIIEHNGNALRVIDLPE